MAMIKIQKLSLQFGDRTVIENFSAEIAQGAITAIVGRNGAGKSTLLAAIAGDIQASAGSISLQDRVITTFTLSELAAVRAMAQQSHSYWMAYTAREILLLGNERASQSRLTYLIEQLNLSDFLNQSVTTLSGGELQRIEIARALLREVPLILLDEPFASQDLTSIKKIKELLQSEKSWGATIVLVDHARDEDLAWCDHVIDLDLTSPVQ